MNILLTGMWHSNVHEEPLKIAFESLGHRVYQLKWSDFFKTGFFSNVQLKLSIGPAIRKVNKSLFNFSVLNDVDLIVIHRGSIINKNTICNIRNFKPNVKIVVYNNDNPFSSKYPFYYWRVFKKCIPYYDVIFGYRPSDEPHYLKFQAKKFVLLKPWFIPWIHKPLNFKPTDKLYDVVFIGHYEDDGRVEFLEFLSKHGVKLKLFGHNEWNNVILKSEYLSHHFPVKTVWNEDYNIILNQAKISLCILSTLNNDVYTRRCFEIPAAGSLLLAPKTTELSSIFRENYEAIYYTDSNDALIKIRTFLDDSVRLNMIAKNGLFRVKNDNHDIISRASYILSNSLG